MDSERREGVDECCQWGGKPWPRLWRLGGLPDTFASALSGVNGLSKRDLKG